MCVCFFFSTRSLSSHALLFLFAVSLLIFFLLVWDVLLSRRGSIIYNIVDTTPTGVGVGEGGVMVGVHAEDGSQVRRRAPNSFMWYCILEPTQPNERYIRLARER